MPTSTPPTVPPRFCSACGTKYNDGARFCHQCGLPIEGRTASASDTSSSNVMRVAVPLVALVAVVVISAVQLAARGDAANAGSAIPLGAGMGGGRAPDISAMSPQERADRLFNRVMLLTSQGKLDSAAFFAPMARGAIEALAPLNAHLHYDLGLVSLVTGDAQHATAQADSILAERSTHLLGLVLAARAADLRGDLAAATSFRRRLLEAEQAERAVGLPEYLDHDADIRAAVDSARGA